MELKEGKKSLEEILILNSGLAMLMNLPTTISFGLKVGEVKQYLENIIKVYDKSKSSITIKLLEDKKNIASKKGLSLEEKKLKIAKLDQKFNEDDETALNTIYEIKYPIIKQKDLEELEKKFEDEFKLTNTFYTLMVNYIE